MAKDFQDKVVLVTGGSRRLGRASLAGPFLTDISKAWDMDAVNVRGGSR